MLAVPVEDGSLSVQQLPTSHVAQPDKSTTGSVSVWTQTAFERMSQPSIPKHQPEYGPHKRFSRKEEEILYTEELGHIKGTKVICSLDLLLQQLAGPCKFPGCIHMATLEYSLCGTCALQEMQMACCPITSKRQLQFSRQETIFQKLKNLQST